MSNTIDEAIRALESSTPYSCQNFSLESDKRQNSDIAAHNKAIEALRTLKDTYTEQPDFSTIEGQRRLMEMNK